MVLSNHNPCNGLRCSRPAEQHRPAHTPRAIPVCDCGALARLHRPRHKPRINNDPTTCTCGAASSHHRHIRSPADRARRAPRREWRDYLGFDGEGVGRRPHRYVLLAVSSESGQYRRYVEDYNGLSTQECLDFILSLPTDVQCFGFSLGYDITKILADLDDATLYSLYHPEQRRRGKRIAPVKWNGYAINLLGTKFSVAKGKRRRVIWDVFKFFQCSFVKALTQWQIADEQALARMRHMKAHRSEFDQQSPDEIREYCFEECAYLAQLVQKLLAAHKDVGITLTDYYGPGSTAKAVLKEWHIEKHEPPGLMRDAVSRGFFGGRFEHSIVGEISGPIYGWDIASAYPYAATFLPCLSCGVWRYTKDETLIDSSVCLVRYSLIEGSATSWAPYPYRDSVGNITFPASSAGGWVYGREFGAGKRVFGSRVRFHAAWVLDRDCDCAPFAKIPHYYLWRLQAGKDAKGIAIKLALNSLYGKLAQSVGSAEFQNWIWAGLITSDTRAMILEAMAAHQDLSNLLAIATDGIYTREQLTLPAPRNTGTNHRKKPLGSWEGTIYPEGMFFVRPGLYFPLGDCDEDKLRARGIGRRAMSRSQEAIRRHLLDIPRKRLSIANVDRFLGAKTSITKSSRGFKRSPDYGEWVKKEFELSNNPRPKRAAINADNTLSLVRDTSGRVSAPYKKAIPLPGTEAFELMIQALYFNEQPDGEYYDY